MKKSVRAVAYQGVVVGGGRGPWSLQFFRNYQIFGNFNVSLENSWTITVGKDEGFEIYWKIFELGSLYPAGAKTPL